jgi:hypothetical protein
MINAGTAAKLLTGNQVEALQDNGVLTDDRAGIEAAMGMLAPRQSKMALIYPGKTMTLLANLLVIGLAQLRRAGPRPAAQLAGRLHDQQADR